MSDQIKLVRDADIVFCIDCTGSMGPILDVVKQNALSFHSDLMAKMAKKNKQLDKVRVRVIAFRDYREALKDNNPPMLATNFFNLPQDAEKFAASVRGLIPIGGGDDPEDGLEALGFAIRSDWKVSEGNRKCRHVIALWTDNAPHELGYGRGCPGYPEEMARNIEELTSWWGDGLQANGYMPDKSQRRLLLYAPEVGAWKFISDNWNQVILYPAELGKGIREQEYNEILDALTYSL